MSTRSTLSSYSMASQVKVADQKKEIEDLRRQLKEAVQGQSAIQYQATPVFNLSVPPPGLNTPSGKRHSSQQLERTSKDPRVGGLVQNRFNVLSQPDSYPDKSMKPSSIASTPGVSGLGGDFNFHVQAEVHGTPANFKPHPASASIRSTQPGHLGNHGHIGQTNYISSINNVKALREELEIAIGTMNGMPFRGTVTLNEAKHCIYKECLRFSDFTNFDGARTGYRNGPVVIFKLKQAINIDELFHVQHFEFRRKSSRQGRTHVDIITCKIRGIRQPGKPSPPSQTEQSKQEMDEGIRTIKLEG